MVAITVSANSRPWIDVCLRSLLDSVTDGVELEVVVVDNASTDGSADLVATEFPSVRLVRNTTNEGFAGGNNVGIRYALAIGADYVFLVNPDTRTPAGLLQALVDFLQAWPDYGLVGPMQSAYTKDGSPSDTLNEWSQEALRVGESHFFIHTWPNHDSSAGPEAGRAPRTLEHSYVQGAALVCRTEVLRRIGLFDAAYHSYYEESDLCRRTRWAGWRVALLLDHTIQHFGGGGSRHSLYRRRKMLRNKYYFLFTDPGWTVLDTMRLAGYWLWLDLHRKGAAPAATVAGAAGDILAAVGSLLLLAPRILRQRRRHHRLLRTGAGGPLRLTGAAGRAGP